jgi:hypothetical protein
MTEKEEEAKMMVLSKLVKFHIHPLLPPLQDPHMLDASF